MATTRTRGALIWDFNQRWSVEEIEIGGPRDGEVKVQLEASGMCHSDHHLVTGSMPMAGFPVLGGHEGAGIVTEVGPGVRDLEPGDHVVLSFIPSCGKCRSCLAGRGNLCDLGAYLLSGQSVSDGSFRVRARGHDVYPMSLLGTFSPYAVVHQNSVVKIDAAVPLDVACLLGCGVTTGYGSAVNAAEVRPGEDVAVIGLGGLGMAALQGAVHAGARYIFAVDPVPWKLDQAMTFGATHAYESLTEATAAAATATEGAMPSKVIVTVGEVAGKDIDSYMGLTAKAGTCVITAMGSLLDSDATFNISMHALLQKTLKGSLFGSSNPHSAIPLLASMYLAGKLNLDDMITHFYDLADINDGYQDMLNGKNIRGVIRYTDSDR